MKIVKVVTLCTAMLFGPSVGFAGDHDGDDDKEEHVAFSTAPVAVQATFTRLAGAGAPKKLELERDQGKTVWEGAYKADGVNQEAKVGDKGEVLEIEKEVATSALPLAVRNAILQKFPGAMIKEAEEVHNNGQTAVSFYEAELSGAGKVDEVKVRANGEFLK